MTFDPTKFGATPVTTKPTGFDPSKFGATPVVQATTPSQDQSVLGAGLNAGVEAISNLPSSTFNFLKGLFGVALHPINTGKGIGKIAAGGIEKLVPGTQEHEQAFGQFVDVLKNRYGSLEALQKTATEDPFGFGADVLSVIQGGASLAGKTGLVDNAISKTSKLATTPIAKTAEVIGNTTSKATKFGISQATGLEPRTIEQIVSNPQQFSRSAREAIDRPTLANDVKSALDTRLKSLRDTGAGYDTIRNTEGTVNIPKGTVESVLNKYGVKFQLDEGGKAKVILDKESRPLSTADRTAIEDFYDLYGKERTLSNNAFLNAREALSSLGKYEQGKTSIPTSIARELRSSYDALGKSQIKGLPELDATYAPERQLLNQAKKDFFAPDGTLKDSAISKIANATGAGKDKLLARLEELSPGVTQKIKVLKAVEDIERASGLKVGTYARALGVGGQVAVGNILGAIVTAILTAPEVAVPLIKGYGLSKAQIVKVLQKLRQAGEAVNNLTAMSI